MFDDSSFRVCNSVFFRNILTRTSITRFTRRIASRFTWCFSHSYTLSIVRPPASFYARNVTTLAKYTFAVIIRCSLKGYLLSCLISNNPTLSRCWDVCRNHDKYCDYGNSHCTFILCISTVNFLFALTYG